MKTIFIWNEFLERSALLLSQLFDDQFAWFDPDLIRRDESKAKPLHGVERMNQTTDVKVIPVP